MITSWLKNNFSEKDNPESSNIRHVVLDSSINAPLMTNEEEILLKWRGGAEGKDVTNNSIFRIMVALNKRVKQLYQQTYNPPTNNDLNKSINDLSSRISIIENKLKWSLDF